MCQHVLRKYTVYVNVQQELNQMYVRVNVGKLQISRRFQQLENNSRALIRFPNKYALSNHIILSSTETQTSVYLVI